jgi:hypothetical protein
VVPELPPAFLWQATGKSSFEERPSVGNNVDGIFLQNIQRTRAKLLKQLFNQRHQLERGLRAHFQPKAAPVNCIGKNNDDDKFLLTKSLPIAVAADSKQVTGSLPMSDAKGSTN